MYTLKLESIYNSITLTLNGTAYIQYNDIYKSYSAGTYTIQNIDNNGVIIEGDKYSDISVDVNGIISFILKSDNTQPITLKDMFYNNNTIKHVEIIDIPVLSITNAFRNSTVECVKLINTGPLESGMNAFMDSNIKTICIDTSHIENFSNMFANTKYLYDVCCLNTSNGKEFSGMFYNSSLYRLECIDTTNLGNASRVINCDIALKCDETISCAFTIYKLYDCNTMYDCDERIICIINDMFSNTNTLMPNAKYRTLIENGYKYNGECK